MKISIWSSWIFLTWVILVRCFDFFISKSILSSHTQRKWRPQRSIFQMLFSGHCCTVNILHCNLSLLLSDCLLKRDCRLLFELGPLHWFFSCAVLYTRINWDNVQKLALVGFVWYQLMESGKGKELGMQESYSVARVLLWHIYNSEAT